MLKIANKVKNEVANKDFNQALADSNNRNILFSISNKFRNDISKEELKNRRYMALFQCMRQHDYSGKVKFTTSLYYHMKWQCYKALKFEAKGRLSYIPLLEHEDLVDNSSLKNFEVDECLNMISEHYSKILRHYYFEDMNLREIGLANGYSHETARIKLEQAKQAFREVYED